MPSYPVKTGMLVLAACLALVACARGGSASADQLVDIGTHRLQLHCQGRGTPAVVIDAGIGDSLEKLGPLQAGLARHTQVVAYNRAGYGKSGAGPLPRDCGREAEELKRLLERAAVPAPYVLVGHSLGGLNMQAFAAMYPREVAGMVLLDPPPVSFLLKQDHAELGAMAERMTAEWQAIADAGGDQADFFRMIASEHREMFGASARRVASLADFGDLLLVVVAAGRANPGFGENAEEFQKYWIEQNRRLSAKSTRGRFILAEGASHYLYLDAPDLVAKTIAAAVDEARAK